MSLRLSYRLSGSIPTEVAGIMPDALADKSTVEIERVQILHGNRTLPLAELFTVVGDARDGRIEWSGDLRSVHRIGAGMTCGEILCEGSVGRHLGSGLRGGKIDVAGDADNWAGAEAVGGTIHIHGCAGDQLGAAYRGSVRGLSGATILVDGDAEHDVGGTMRRGLIVVGGSVGDLAGFNMIAGSLFIFGSCGVRPAAGMRRGTVGLFGATRSPLLPTFRSAGSFRPPIMPLVVRHLRSLGFVVDAALADAEFEVFQGDLVTVGRGEVFTRIGAAVTS